jgi:hypothetical protein
MSLTVEAELRTLKVVAEKAMSYIYPQDLDTALQAPKLLDMLPT